VLLPWALDFGSSADRLQRASIAHLTRPQTRARVFEVFTDRRVGQQHAGKAAIAVPLGPLLSDMRA
jgi:hypothetical protein